MLSLSCWTTSTVDFESILSHHTMSTGSRLIFDVEFASTWTFVEMKSVIELNRLQTVVDFESKCIRIYHFTVALSTPFRVEMQSKWVGLHCITHFWLYMNSFFWILISLAALNPKIGNLWVWTSSLQVSNRALLKLYQGMTTFTEMVLVLIVELCSVFYYHHLVG